MSRAAAPGATGRVTRVRLATAAMGTRFELVLVDEPDPDRPEEKGPGWLRSVGEAAIDEIKRWHARLSRFLPESLLSHLNRTAHARAVHVDGETFDLFHDALTVAEATGGAFDVTGGTGRVILDGERRTVRYGSPDTQVDLGGIAKGHALDHAAAVLRRHGVRCALLHGGTSSVLAIGRPRGTPGWRVALGPDPEPATVDLTDGALAVSSPSPAGNEGHILDPRTGKSVTGGTRFGVTGPSARLADAWATATAVLGTRPPGCGPEWRIHIH